MGKKVSLRILITTLLLYGLIGFSFLTSCTFLDNYVVKKQDYDNLKNDRDKITQDYRKQLEVNETP